MKLMRMMTVAALAGTLTFAGNAPAQDDASPDESAEAEAPGLSDDAFSSMVSRRRSQLQSELRSLQKEQRGLEREMESLARDRKNALKKYGGQLQGVTGAPADVKSDREEDLAEKKEELAEREKKIRESFETLREQAAQRNGGKVPGWWRPLN